MSATAVCSTISVKPARTVVSTRFRVRRLCPSGDPSEAVFTAEAEARGRQRTLIDEGTTGVLVVLERLDLVAADDRHPQHYEATSIQRDIC